MLTSKKVIVNALLTAILLTGCNSPNEIAEETTLPSEDASTVDVKEESVEKVEAFLTIDREKSLKKEANGAFYIYGGTSDNSRPLLFKLPMKVLECLMTTN